MNLTNCSAVTPVPFILMISFCVSLCRACASFTPFFSAADCNDVQLLLVDGLFGALVHISRRMLLQKLVIVTCQISVFARQDEQFSCKKKVLYHCKLPMSTHRALFPKHILPFFYMINTMHCQSGNIITTPTPLNELTMDAAPPMNTVPL